MNRLSGLVAAGIAAIVSVASASAAYASTAQIQQFNFHGTVAEAVWDTSSPTASTSTDVTVSRNQEGTRLTLFQSTNTFDATGTYTGSQFTTVDVTSGFTLFISGALSSASVSGEDLPATTCAYDATGTFLGCTDTTVDLTVTWTGQGPISRGESTAHFHSDGFTSTFHQQGIFRDATATGTVDGLTLSATDLVTAQISNSTNGSLEVCTGTDC